MAEFLLELLGEEIPARMQRQAAEDLRTLFCGKLEEAGLPFTAAAAHVTPRRLALVVDGLPLTQPDALEERKGPKVGSPEGAIQGFLKGANLASLDQAEQRDTGKGVFWFAVTKRMGRPTEDILEEITGAVIAQFPWPKSMRWSAHPLKWVRPLHGILMVLDGKAIEAKIEFGATFSKTGTQWTVGHRFLAPQPFAVTGFDDYRAKLSARFVILDRDERKAEIQRQLNSAVSAAGLKLVQDEKLLEEVTGLVEWPTVLLGNIDAEYMGLPREVRQLTMRDNQRYFTLENPDGTSAPFFALVANVPGEADGGRTIVAGNERVLRARLSDARFFWDQDCKATLASRLSALKGITFHAQLGTMRERADRISELAATLAPHIPKGDVELSRQAGLLCKADLVTGMVGEFPELQGIMGGYYARNEQLPEGIATAIADHYKPAGPSDRCPSNPVAIAVALADKLDTLVGFFSIGEIPTGSRDPYALRRAGLGVIRIIRENSLAGLSPLLMGIVASIDTAHGRTSETGKVFDFLVERLQGQLKVEGIGIDRVRAVSGPQFSMGDLLRIVVAARDLQQFLDKPEGIQLVGIYRRAANILAIESRDGGDYSPGAEQKLLIAPEEIELSTLLYKVLPEAHDMRKAARFGEAMMLLTGLKPSLDAFMDKVLINDLDPAVRRNRLKLLASIVETFETIADFSKIEL